MNKFLLVLKEIGIAILILVVIAGINVFVFYDRYPVAMEIPAAKDYAKIERSRYSVTGDIQDAQNATETFTTTSSELELYQTEIRYVPGTTNPFVAENGGTDLPSETVSSSSVNSSRTNNTNNAESTDTKGAE